MGFNSAFKGLTYFVIPLTTSLHKNQLGMGYATKLLFLQCCSVLLARSLESYSYASFPSRVVQVLRTWHHVTALSSGWYHRLSQTHGTATKRHFC